MKKSIFIIATIIFVVIASIAGKVIYSNIYVSRVNEELKKAGLNPKDYVFDETASLEEIRRTITQHEINETLLEMGISPNEVDLSDIDFTGLDTKEIYDLIYKEVVKQKTQQQINQQTSGGSEAVTTVPSSSQTTTYRCVADSTVAKRGYIVIHGAGGPDSSETIIKSAVSADPSYGGFLYFTYDANKETLSVITSRFVSEYNTFAAQGYDKIIIYGQSAGGVIASYAASQLGAYPKVEIHTLASPINGYKFGSAAEQIAQQFTGLNKEIGLGIDSYAKPSSNITVYHHKTVEDQTLRSFCGSYASLCSPSVIQDNNVPGSSEYKYPNDTHESISNTVVASTLSCRK